MKWINNDIGVLNDKSILVFNLNGNVKLYPAKNWKKPKNKNFHEFKFKNKLHAIKIWKIIENLTKL